MSWIRETPNKPWYQRLACKVLQQGQIPKHLAVIMDGNRRFAKEKSIATAEGHVQGFDRLAMMLEWCLDLGINEVTVYAFSIENFKRSKEEVDALMDLARKKFARLMEEKELIHKHGVCFRVWGDITLLPKDIQVIIAEGVEMTKHNDRAFLNVCFSYTSREEICTSMREIVDGVQMGLIRESDISEDVISRCLYSGKSRDPDLLVRTSGEVRLSDFLLWQSTYSVLSFMKVLWPDFSVWHLYAGVLHYQRNYNAVEEAKQENALEVQREIRESDNQCVLDEIEEEKKLGTYNDSESFHERLEKYTNDRENRLLNFYAHVDSKREQFLQDLLKSESRNGFHHHH